MATFLFKNIIFGPVNSRRLGKSLGINLLPEGCKVCNFNCIYCECGWNSKSEIKQEMPSKNDVLHALEEKLIAMNEADDLPDTLTFAGNGEPTLHPDFLALVEAVIVLRDKYCPGSKIAVLSNGTRVGIPAIFEALTKVDYNILKLDSAFADGVNQINKPVGPYNLHALLNEYAKFDNLTIQTLFMTGEYEGKIIDNSTSKEVNAWLEVLKKVNPRLVMIYTIERDTPASGLKKIPCNILKKIGDQVKASGFEVVVSC